MRFAALGLENSEEVLYGYLEASSFEAARLKAAEKYGASVTVELIKDEEYNDYLEDELDFWASLQDYGKGEATSEMKDQAKQDLHTTVRKADLDRDIKEILSRNRIPGQVVTHEQIRGLTQPQTRCINCGAVLSYSTRPHTRCKACQVEHRRRYDRDRKRLERQ